MSFQCIITLFFGLFFFMSIRRRQKNSLCSKRLDKCHNMPSRSISQTLLLAERMSSRVESKSRPLKMENNPLAMDQLLTPTCRAHLCWICRLSPGLSHWIQFDKSSLTHAASLDSTTLVVIHTQGKNGEGGGGEDTLPSPPPLSHVSV